MNGLLSIKETARGFEVKSKYNEKLVEDLRAIKDGYWKKQQKVWFIPMHRENELTRLKIKYGIMVDPAIDVPQQVGNDLPPMKDLLVPVPLKRKLFPYQEQGVQRGLELERFINGDAPGLGKTQQAIATAIAADCKCILVVCPNTLKLNWKIEWKMVAGWNSMILGEKNKTSWKSYHEVGMIKVFIVNFESIRKFFVQASWKKPKGKDFKSSTIPFKEDINLFDCLIVDESHKCKEITTDVSKFLLGMSKGKRIRQLLTGTPVVNKPRDLIPQLSIAGKLKLMVEHIPDTIDRKTGKPKDPSGMDRFMERYCDGGRGASNLKELNYRLRKYVFFRREKKDVLHDLPDKIRQIQYCEISNRKEYDIAENEFVRYLREIKGCNSEQEAKKLRGGMMVKMGILRNVAARGKMEAAEEYIRELVDSGEKVVVFTWLNDTIDAVKKLFPQSVQIRGGMKPEDRQTSVERFQNDPDTNVIALNIKAGGVGLTLHASSEVLLIEQPWTDADVEQCIDRTHRIGQLEKVRAGILLGRNTIDEYIYFDIILKKRRISSDITGAEIIEDDIVNDLLSFFDRRMKEVSE